MRPTLFTRGLSGLSQSSDPNSPGGVTSPVPSREDAKRTFFKVMRPLPLQHYWHMYIDKLDTTTPYQERLELLDKQIDTVKCFWENHEKPFSKLQGDGAVYLFKAGYKPVWEDRRNVLGGSWTFRVPKSAGRRFWLHVQLLAVGDAMQSFLEEAKFLASLFSCFSHRRVLASIRSASAQCYCLNPATDVGIYYQVTRSAASGS